MKNNEVQTGALYAGFAYFLWGILPVYWKFLDHVQADEIFGKQDFLVVFLYADDLAGFKEMECFC